MYVYRHHVEPLSSRQTGNIDLGAEFPPPLGPSSLLTSLTSGRRLWTLSFDLCIVYLPHKPPLEQLSRSGTFRARPTLSLSLLVLLDISMSDSEQSVGPAAGPSNADQRARPFKVSERPCPSGRREGGDGRWKLTLGFIRSAPRQVAHKPTHVLSISNATSELTKEPSILATRCV